MDASNNKAREISLGDNFGDVVVKVNGTRIEVDAAGHVAVSQPGAGALQASPANDSLSVPSAANSAHRLLPAKAALEVGEHLKDGTVVIAVDLEHNEALFAPEGIFGGKSTFGDQDDVVEKVNGGVGAHGHKDWRRITDAEGKKLSDAWDKVAPPALPGRADPWFWIASRSYYGDYGRVRRGGVADSDICLGPDDLLPVPVVRSGPARS